MRPSASWITTPYSRVSSTRFTVSVRDSARLLWRSTSRQVDVGQGVAGDHQERVVAEEVGARRARRRRCRAALLQAVLEPVAEVVPDRVREVVEVGDHVVEAVALEQADDVRHHRPVEDRDHRLRKLVCDRPQAGTEPGRQKNRLHRV